MKFSSDLAVFTPAGATRVAEAPVAWAPVPLAEPAPVALALPDPAEEAAQRHADEVQDAYARGQADGAQQARTQLQRDVQAAATMLAQAAAQLRAAEAARLGSLQADLAALAVAITRHMLGREAMDGQALADLIRRALADFPGEQPVRVRVNPHDLSTLTAVKTADGGALPIAAGRELTWVPDAELERGGVVVEGRERIVDGRVDLALERIYRRLADG